MILPSLRKVAELYGKPNAIKVESLFRNETAHFTSGCFLKCFCPGMEAVKKPDNSVLPYPYGWTSLREFWDTNPNYKPTGIHLQVENDSAMMKSRGERAFIIFPSLEAAVMTVAFRLKNKGWDTGAWSSNDKAAQDKYRTYLLGIKTPLANSL